MDRHDAVSFGILLAIILGLILFAGCTRVLVGPCPDGPATAPGPIIVDRLPADSTL